MSQFSPVLVVRSHVRQAPSVASPVGEMGRAMEPLRSRMAMTLIEVLIVVGVIATLAAMSLPILGTLRRKADRDNTRLLVDTVATQIISSGTFQWVYVDQATGTRTFKRNFDWNADHLLDGHYGKSTDADTVGGIRKDSYLPYIGPTSARISVDPAYQGFLIATQTAVDLRWQQRLLSANTGTWESTGVLVDAWWNRDQDVDTVQKTHVLRIDYHATKYGPRGVGVWSCGPDGKTSLDTSVADDDLDDICSWKSE